MSVVLERDDRLERPVIKIPVDPKPSFKSLFSDVVVAVTGTRPPKTMNFMSVLTMLIHQLLAQKTKLLIFDDVQHISEHRGPEGIYKAADVFKVLMKSARMQIVLIGLPHAREIMLANTQLHEMTSRVHQVSPFVLDGREGEFVQFLEAIEGELPFDKASDISGDEVAVRIHHATDGYVGRISHLLIDAVDYALEEGLGRLDRTALAGMLRDHRGIGSHLNPFLLDENELKEFQQTIHAERSKRQRAAEDRQTRTAGVRQRRRDLGVRGR
ncbi:ATP-binding protein [Aureimonas leprariae]|uniref:AAA family ATPase n=1 Tax=Plantimonas leprariae TaxID=2615207 RepID=A0A7V7PP72_9HYPH|nr:ATP-binding protein [Aureimonas leprariae]KAB0679714.1 AAA family ATPase [Aureimonas leprariae]